jgi:hypothetical protein
MFPLKGFKIDIGLVHMAFIVDNPQVHENQVSNSRSDEHRLDHIQKVYLRKIKKIKTFPGFLKIFIFLSIF